MYNKKRIFSDKNIIIMSIVSIIAVSALAAGVMFFNRENPDNEIQIAELEDDTTKELETNEQNVNADVEKENTTLPIEEITQKASDLSPAAIDSKESDSETSNTDTASDRNNSSNKDTEANSKINEQPTTADSTEVALNPSSSILNFDKNSSLIWPVETNDIIIEFSMDKTTYFATLDMYKTSDAICIRSDLGSPVYASCKGVVKTIGYNEEIGHFITLELGNHYELTYGQLKDIQLVEGDQLKEGDLLGYISEPTKYYSIEGPNLYLQMSENGNPIDPMDYLNY